MIGQVVKKWQQLFEINTCNQHLLNIWQLTGWFKGWKSKMAAAAILHFGNLHFRRHRRVLNQSCNIPTKFGDDPSNSSKGIYDNSFSKSKMAATAIFKSTLPVQTPS